ncbi:MAG: hypothetical protein ACXVH7_07215 [Thermoanaerobaculia bacterium]
MTRTRFHLHGQTITFDDGGMNLLSGEALRELHEIIRPLATGDQRLIVFRSGRPNVFAAGADMAEMQRFTSLEAEAFSRAGQELFDAIGLSILSGAHNVLFPEIMRLLKEEGADDVVVFAGGIIPEQDIPKLKAMGIREIFLPGTRTAQAVDAIRAAVHK